MSAPPSAGQWWLFDSTNPLDHMEARKLCKVCPMRAECLQLASVQRHDGHGLSLIEGTWGGRLYGSKSKDRISIEDGMFSDEEAREAHAAWVRAVPSRRNRAGLGERIVMGERVYQRRAQRRRKAANEQRKTA